MPLSIVSEILDETSTPQERAEKEAQKTKKRLVSLVYSMLRTNVPASVFSYRVLRKRWEYEVVEFWLPEDLAIYENVVDASEGKGRQYFCLWATLVSGLEEAESALLINERGSKTPNIFELEQIVDYFEGFLEGFD